MGIVAAIAVGVSTGFSIYSQEKARGDAKQARKEQEKSQQEQRAQQTQQQAEERRRLVREERVRRARLLQSSENTGSSGSSGEIGAIGGLSTNLSTSIGTSLGNEIRSNNISIFEQNASDFLGSAQDWTTRGNQVQQLGNAVAGLSLSFAKPTKQ